MKNYCSLILYALLFFLGDAALNAQCPDEGELIFTTQAEIDQFIIEYPNCSVVENLNVSGTDITNLNGLVNIESVYGAVAILDCPMLTSISGLNNISYIEESLTISNTGIETIDENDFSSLMHVGYQVNISSNENLESITGFQGLNELISLLVQGNPVLTSLNTFNNIIYLWEVSFISLNSLEAIEGFSSLQGMDLLNISSTPLLFDLGIFSEIEFIGSLEIDNVPWTSLGMLSTVFWFGLSISNCPNLVDISQLVNFGGCSYFYIFNNPNLSDCCTLSYLVEFNGFIELYIDNNAYGCNSLNEIELECIIIPSCPPGNVAFSSQAEVDQFLIDYPDCPQIFGTLTISGNDITNLDALANIEQINGDFIITSNQALTDISGFQNLQTIEGALTISDNNSLQTLSGFLNFANVWGDFVISGNQTLMEVSGFLNLQTIGGALTISDNGSLQTLSGFQNLVTVGGNMLFTDLPTLNSILNFNNLTNVGGNFELSELVLLSNISAFFNLENVEASFTLANNLQFNDLNSFCSLTTVGALNISNNQSLADCCNIQPLAEALNSTDVTIVNNAFGCNSVTEIETDCQALPAGNCPSGSLVFLTQAEIDQFAIDYPNCTEINGYLGISGDDVVNLDALQNIETISGGLHVYQTTQLTEINGFNKLQTISDLLLINNHGLLSVNGFNSLKTIDFLLDISSNENLESINGFESLQSIYAISFYSNPSLVSVTNFAKALD